MTPLKLSAWVLVAACMVPARAAAQQPEPAAGPPKGNVTPIRVQVVLSRFQGDKKVSSMPYTLSFNVNADRPSASNLRMGSKIPIKMLLMAGGGDKPAPGPIQYQDVGTNIDCRATMLGDGRFTVDVTVDDTSVYGEDAAKLADQPSFRSFRATNSMVLKDGQTGQFTSAVDKVSGEVTRVDVTLTVVR
jgi:hypothetical protein